MTKKRKILIVIGSLVLFFTLVATSFYGILRTNSKTIDNVLIKMAEKAEIKKEEKLKKTEGENGVAEVKRARKAREKTKNSKLATEENFEITPLEIQQSRGYEKIWGSINTINRVALWLRSRDNSEVDDPSAANDDILEVIFFSTSMFSPSTFNNFLTVDADCVYYASMEAMYDQEKIRWETKYFIAQLLGERGERRALPLFRKIVADENEAFLVRITSIDQIGNLKDEESNELVLSLLDNELPVMRNKASDIVCDITEIGDKAIYDNVLAHYYNEEDPAVKASLLGTAIYIGREDSLADVEKILETATDMEKNSIIANTALIHSEESFEILKRLYDPKDENSSFVIMSLANLEMREANQFLYGIIEEVNGINSVMAASYLVEDHNQIEAIPYIEEAMGKEKNPEFINNYQELLVKFHQSGDK